jgi:multidrug resistance efflux pump
MKQTVPVSVFAIGLTALAVLGLVLFWPHAPLDAALVSTDAPAARLVCSGSVDSRQGPLLLQTARAGRVVRVLVHENETIRKDTPLVQLDDHLVKVQEEEAEFAVQAAQLQLTRAKNGLKQYQARRAQAEAALEAANSKALAGQYALARREDLMKYEMANQLEVQSGRAQLDQAKALVKVEQNRLDELKAVDPGLEVQLAQLQLDLSQKQLERVRDERAEYRLLAPTHGLVARVQAQEGDLIGPTSPRPAVWLVPAGGWIVRVEVSQEFAGQVRNGQAALVEDEASGRVLARGTIGEVSNWFLPRRQFSAQPTSINTGVTLECVVNLDDDHGQLRLGERVRVRILADPAAGNSKVRGKDGSTPPR